MEEAVLDTDELGAISTASLHHTALHSVTERWMSTPSFSLLPWLLLALAVLAYGWLYLSYRRLRGVASVHESTPLLHQHSSGYD